ncbi:MAG: Zn-dependent protease with chaperone function, partial [Singulisphaera sp.]|nr:Zn-dependent protease with chaperone function [Singulisphaera sp.]
MPFSLLIALFLAFGTDSPANLGPIPRSELAPKLREILLGVSLVALVAGVLGRWVAFRASQRGKPSQGLRRLHA